MSSTCIHKVSSFLALGFALSFSLAPFAFAEDWLDHEKTVAVTRLLANIGPKDARPGVVIASPQRQNPDYYFHWTRDAALVMDVVGRMDGKAITTKESLNLEKLLFDYSDFSRQNQAAPALTGLGEPKFHVDGTSYNGPWARPQNDGPALRAIALIRFAEKLIRDGQLKYVKTHLYDSEVPSRSVIKVDLDYVSNFWKMPGFDLWEECKGDHFYTRMVQRKALILGAGLATRLGDPQAAAWYLSQAQELKKEIEKHWDAKKGMIVATLNRVEGIDYKASNIDVAVLLGALHGDAGDGFFTVTDSRVQATMKFIEDAFKRLYPINSKAEIPGIAIGRYPEDKYAGNEFTGGNPWVLATLAFGEAHYKIAKSLLDAGDSEQGAVHLAQAGTYIDRVEKHAGPEGALAEQIQRQTGAQTSAADLTWNYAAILTAYWAKEELRAK